MKLVTDTSAYSAFNRGDQRLKKWFRSTNDLIMPLIVVGELRAGFAAGRRTQENELLLQRFLDDPSVQTVSITEATTKAFAAVYHQLRTSGTPIGTNDLWIAALCLEHNLPLLTLDTDFAYVADLKLAKI